MPTFDVPHRPVPRARWAAALMALVLWPLCDPAQAGVIGFDDLSGDGRTALADGHAGFVWHGAVSVANSLLPGSGWSVAAVSGANSLGRDDGTEWQLTRPGDGLFDVGGAWFTSAWQPQQLVFEGWLGGQLVHSSLPVGIDTGTPTWVGLNWSGIDRWVVANSLAGAGAGAAWALDDLDVTPVPEPGSASLWLLALAALGPARHHRLRRGAVQRTHSSRAQT